MQVKLKVLLGAAAGREIQVPVSKFLIGRGEECHLRPRSEAISRQHCAIIINESKVAVRDLQSRNGTAVNGTPVDGIQELQPGDKVQVGPLAFEVIIEHPLGGTKRPEVRDVKEVAERTANAQPEDLDIAEWLDALEQDDADTDVTAPRTRQFHLQETSNIALDTDVTTEQTVVDEQGDVDAAGNKESGNGAQTAVKDKKKSKKDGPGKLPPTPKLSTVDSREAAADMLKKFFNRR